MDTFSQSRHNAWWAHGFSALHFINKVFAFSPQDFLPILMAYYSRYGHSCVCVCALITHANLLKWYPIITYAIQLLLMLPNYYLCYPVINKSKNKCCPSDNWQRTWDPPETYCLWTPMTNIKVIKRLVFREITRKSKLKSLWFCLRIPWKILFLDS